MQQHPLPAGPPDGSACVQVCGPVRPGEVEQLCARVRAELATGCARVVVCLVQGEADLGVVELVVRLELLARRGGVRLHVRANGAGLDELLRLTGLSDVVGR